MTTIEQPKPVLVTDRRRELRVKIKSLAVEARIIRDEERRCRDSLTRTVGHDDQRRLLASAFTSLRAHRVGDVRRESRYSLLAYALIRGRPLRMTEPKSKIADLDQKKLASLVARFGCLSPDAAAKAVLDWLAFLGA
jgi:hypothetical protein